jgi:hypothetical protein
MAVPMDKESVTRRLREVAELSHLCRQLAGPRWPYRLANLPRLLAPESPSPSGSLAETPPPYRAAESTP